MYVLSALKPTTDELAENKIHHLDGKTTYVRVYLGFENLDRTGWRVVVLGKGGSELIFKAENEYRAKLKYAEVMLIETLTKAGLMQIGFEERAR